MCHGQQVLKSFIHNILVVNSPVVLVQTKPKLCLHKSIPRCHLTETILKQQSNLQNMIWTDLLQLPLLWFYNKKHRKGLLIKLRNCGRRIMFWYALTGSGLICLVIVNRNLTALLRSLIPKLLIERKEKLIFQQEQWELSFWKDNFVDHFSMKWLALSANLNPIENVWRIRASDV